MSMSAEQLEALIKKVEEGGEEERKTAFEGLTAAQKKQLRNELRKRGDMPKPTPLDPTPAEASKGRKEAKGKEKVKLASGKTVNPEELYPTPAPKPEVETPGDDTEGGGGVDVGSESDISWSEMSGLAGKTSQTKKKVQISEIPEADLDKMWANLDSDDLSMLDLEAIKEFDYQGFNAEAVLKTLMINGRKKSLSDRQIMSDITTLAGLAQKKGSVNDHNYGRMKKSGQQLYDRLAKTYGIVKGSGKNQPAEVVTVSRIGPAFPGRIIQMIVAGKLEPRSFNGPMKSATMVKVIQTQAFPPCIPTTLPERTKDFLLGLCIAYSVDQTINIGQGKGKGKKKPEEIVEDQKGFVLLSHSSNHPSDKVRKQVFAKIEWPAFYDKSSTCSAAYKKFVSDFEVPSRSDFLDDMQKI